MGLSAIHAQVAGLQGELREATSAQAAAKTEADQLLAERAVAAKALATAETAGRKLAKQVVQRSFLGRAH